MILSYNVNTLRFVLESLASGNLVALPTETVYGLAANAFSDEAVKKIYYLKKRPPKNPLILHFPNKEKILESFPILNRVIESKFLKLAEFWPGSLTIVLPTEQEKALLARAGARSVGVRIPNHRITLEILNKLPFPLAAPSANISNYVSPTSAEHVLNSFPDVDLPIMDGGYCSCGIESTIVLLEETRVFLLRPGTISQEVLEEKLQERLLGNYLNTIHPKLDYFG
jgi:L-threonylcarbamoyladenylate synthase